VLEKRRRVLQISPGAEREIARSRDYEDARPLVRGERLDRAADADGGLAVNAVSLIGPVDRENPHGAPILRRYPFRHELDLRPV
jgi:hypothetical protein